VVCGPSGTGKTFLLEALGQAAVETGKHVAWFSLEALGVLVRRHRPDDSLTRAITRILRADLVIVDDMACSLSAPTPPRASTGLSMPPMSAAPSPSAQICTRPGSTS